MKKWTLVTSVLLAGAGTAATATTTHVEADGSTLFSRVASAVWNPEAELEILSIHANHTKLGGYGNEVEADKGYVFYEALVLLRNTGSTPIGASTWHFTAENELGHDTPAETSMAHHDFDGSALRKGADRAGLLVFEMREEDSIRAITWQGELAWARGEVRSPDAREPGAGSHP